MATESSGHAGVATFLDPPKREQKSGLKAWILILCGLCVLIPITWKMVGCVKTAVKTLNTGTTATAPQTASSGMPEGWEPEIIPDAALFDYADAPDTPEYRKIKIPLRAGGYNDFYRLPLFYDQFTPTLSRNPGDWVSVWCNGHARPAAVRYWYQHDNNLGGTMDNCHDAGEKTDGFWIQGKGTLTITITRKKSFWTPFLR